MSFADDIKIFRAIKTGEVCTLLKSDIELVQGFYCCTVHFDICRVQSPKNALFNLKNTLKFALKYTLRYLCVF